MEKNIQRKSESYCLKVPKRLGEEAINLAVKLGILDKNLKIVSLNDYILIPLKGRLGNGAMSEVNRRITEFEVAIHDFPVRETAPKSILDVLEDRLPPHLLASLPKSMDFVGDIAVLEIPEELEPYKRLIGEAVLKVYKHVRSVLAKSGSVKGVYRVREYEVIAGSENTETVHKEHGCKYFLDPRKVYFSPRLSHEHCRVASQVQEGETVVDMFAGVGPFSILIAKTRSKVTIYAIDINPEAIEYLKRNIYANGVHGKVVPILGDAREVVESKLQGVADRVIMNLPEKASEYIDAACMALKPPGGIIHYYEFASGSYAVERVRQRLAAGISKAGRSVETVLSERVVKEVAPYKWQISLDIKVGEKIIYDNASKP